MKKTLKMVMLVSMVMLITLLVTGCSLLEPDLNGELTDKQYENLVAEYEKYTADMVEEDFMFEDFAETKRFVVLSVISNEKQENGNTSVLVGITDSYFCCYNNTVYMGGGYAIGDYSLFGMIDAKIDGDSVKINDISFDMDENWESISKDFSFTTGIKMGVNTAEAYAQLKEKAEEHFGATYNEETLYFDFDPKTGEVISCIWGAEDDEPRTEVVADTPKEVKLLMDFRANPDSQKHCNVDFYGCCEDVEMWEEFYNTSLNQRPCEIFINLTEHYQSDDYVYISYNDGVYRVYEYYNDEDGDYFYISDFKHLIKEEMVGGTAYMLSTSKDATYDGEGEEWYDTTMQLLIVKETEEA